MPRGFTLAELLVALALTLIITTGALSLLNPGQMVFRVQPEVLDMQQRLRMAADAVTRDLRMAGAGLPPGSAPLVPRVAGQRGDPFNTARADAIGISFLPTAYGTPMESHSYVLDAAGAQLRHYDGGVTDTPVADNVVALSFEYFDASDVSIPLAHFADGPWQGSGAAQFDDDVLLIRSVKVGIRVQASKPEFRGTGPAFARPGSSRLSYRYLPDVTASFRVMLRNAGVF